jgi:hypothetical protein
MLEYLPRVPVIECLRGRLETDDYATFEEWLDQFDLTIPRR